MFVVWIVISVKTRKQDHFTIPGSCLFHLYFVSYMMVLDGNFSVACLLHNICETNFDFFLSRAMISSDIANSF